MKKLIEGIKALAPYLLIAVAMVLVLAGLAREKNVIILSGIPFFILGSYLFGKYLKSK